MQKLIRNIEKINVSIENQSDAYFFNEPAQTMDIFDFEIEHDITLPLSYKIFLENFDGGFISQIPVKSASDIETARWNSINLLGLSEIEEGLSKISLRGWQYDDSPEGTNMYIPFCHTAIGELLIFVNTHDEHGECPVFDAFHEEQPRDWGCVYDNFSNFLNSYIKNNGRVKTQSYEEPSALNYIQQSLK